MSEPNLIPAATPPASPPPPAPKRRSRWLVVTGVALAAALTGAVASQALDHGPPWQRGGFMGAPLSPGAAADRADRMIRHLAIEIDATPEQQERLRAIASGAVKDLYPLREKAQTARARARGLLTESTVNRAAIEAFRSEQMALADEASRRFAQAISDAAEVLTPEQRRKIDDHIRWRRERWRAWHRG